MKSNPSHADSWVLALVYEASFFGQIAYEWEKVFDRALHVDAILPRLKMKICLLSP